MSIEKAIGKQIVVEFENGEKVVVKKLPLGKYAQLMLALKKLPTTIVNDLQNIDTANEDALFSTLFGIFGEAWGQVIEIIAIGSGIDADRLENDETIGLDGGVALFLAIYEVNNLEKVVSQVKNAINRSAKK
jgi:hypothetical protein